MNTKEISLLVDTSPHLKLIPSPKYPTNNSKTAIMTKFDSSNNSSYQNHNAYEFNDLSDYSFFEAIDLCMPLGSELNNINNYQSNNFKFVNNTNNINNNQQFSNPNQDYLPHLPRSNSVPVCLLSSQLDDNKKSNLINFNDVCLSNSESNENNEQSVNCTDMIENAPSWFPNIEKSKSNDNVFDLKPHLENQCCRVYTCLARACGREFNALEDTVQHHKTSHKLQVEENSELNFNQLAKLSYKCLFKSNDSQEIKCGKKLENWNKMVNHICKEHLIDSILDKFQQASSNLSKQSTNAEDPNCDQLRKYFVCSLDGCTLVFQNENLLRIHKQSAHKNTKNEPQMNSVSAPGSNATKLPVKKKHICQICDAKFTRPSHLKAHTKLHDSNELTIKCHFCNEMFMKQSLLLSHMGLKHKDQPKILKCTYEGCKKEYISKMYLDSHVARTHLNPANELDKFCNICNKEFAAYWLKRQHDEIKHKGNQLFKCLYESCNKTFPNSSKLHRHSQTHLKEKKYKCQFENCKAEFNRREHLTAHVNIHASGKPFVCHYTNCKASFRYYNNLLTHKKSHSKNSTGLSRFFANENESQDENVVESVSSGFEDSKVESLVDQNEFKCVYCDSDFDSEGSLQIHLKSHLETSVQKEVEEGVYFYALPSGDSLTTECVSAIKQLDKENPHIEINQFINEIATSPTPTPSDLNTSLQCNQVTSPGTFDKHQGSNDFISFLNQENDLEVNFKHDSSSNKNLKQEHIININSDDEEYTTCSVVLENLSGSARTDYKSNHIYIEKYKSKRKQKEKLLGVKRIKVSEPEPEVSYESSKSTSPLSTGSSTTSPLSSSYSSVSSSSISFSIKSTLKHTITSKQTPKRKKSPRKESSSAEQPEESNNSTNSSHNHAVGCFANCTGCLEF